MDIVEKYIKEEKEKLYHEAKTRIATGITQHGIMIICLEYDTGYKRWFIRLLINMHYKSCKGFIDEEHAKHEFSALIKKYNLKEAIK